MAIDQLNKITALSSADLVPIGSQSLGGDAAITAANLAKYVAGQIDPTATPTPAIPTITSAPVIVGTPIVGQSLSYKAGDVAAYPASTRTQQWIVDGVDSVGATGATFTVPVGASGSLIQVRQTETNTSGAISFPSAALSVFNGITEKKTAIYHPTVLFPELSITEAITAAAAAANAAGGGIVKIPSSSVASPIILTASLPLYSGVMYDGSGSGFDLGVTTGSNNYTGTILQGNGTFPAFAYNATDGAVSPTSYAAFLATFLTGGGAQNFVLKNFSYGVKVGALYKGGCQGSIFRNLFAVQCGWGFWFENQILNRFENLNAELCSVGLGAIVNSGGTALNSGNSTCQQLFGEVQGRLQRGWVFWARGATGSFLNDMSVTDIQVNRSRTSVTQAATMANASANITVTDGTQFAVDLPVSFSATVNGFSTSHVYFVRSVAGNVIQVSETIGGAAITATGNTAVNCVHYGFPCLEVVGYGSNGVQPSFFNDIDMEGGGTSRIVVQNAQGVQFKCGTVGGEEGTAIVKAVTVRNSTDCQFNSSSGLSYDIDAASVTTFITGAKVELGAATGQTSCGLGLQVYKGGDIRYQTNSMTVSMYGQFGPTLVINKNSGAIEFSSNPIGYVYYQTVANGGTVPYANLVVYTGAGAGTVTLPTIPANGEGVPVLLSNPSAGILTVNTAGGQTINGSGTTFNIAANSSRQLCSASKSGTLFWVAA